MVTNLKASKLWQKLAANFVFVAVAAIVLSFFTVNLAFEKRFSEYLKARQNLISQQIAEGLALAYLRSGGWTNEVIKVLPHWATVTGVRIKLVATDGRVLADTGGSGGKNKGWLTKKQVKIGSYQVGTVYISPVKLSRSIPSAELKFRKAVNQLIIYGGLLAIALALALSYFVSQRLTKPIEEITKAAKEMEAGHLDKRVLVKSEDEIGKLGNAFNHLANSIQRHQHLQKLLTADIAHELRTPIATIQSHLEAYLDGVMKPTSENLQSIHEEILRLSRLVDSLGEIARLEAGELHLDKSEADLSKLVKKFVEQFRPLFKAKGVRLKLELSKEPILVKVDRDKIKQIIGNLLSNALKFTEAGGTTQVSTAKNSKRATVSVSDSGCGIPPEDLDFIFERFYRVDKSRTRSTGGYGIGLTIANELVKAHQGVIEVKSALKKGTTFTVSLPLNS